MLRNLIHQRHVEFCLQELTHCHVTFNLTSNSQNLGNILGISRVYLSIWNILSIFEKDLWHIQWIYWAYLKIPLVYLWHIFCISLANFGTNGHIYYLGHILGISWARLVVKIEVIASPSASSVSIVGIFSKLRRVWILNLAQTSRKIFSNTPILLKHTRRSSIPT